MAGWAFGAFAVGLVTGWLLATRDDSDPVYAYDELTAVPPERLDAGTVLGSDGSDTGSGSNTADISYPDDVRPPNDDEESGGTGSAGNVT